MRLYIVRHGETDWNISRRLQGQSDTELNEKGRALARVTADALREVSFTLAFTSPLKRAAETAKIILGARNVPLIAEPRICEISFGELEGHCILTESREIGDPNFRSFFQAPEKYCPPKGGESFGALLGRTGDFLDELKMREDLADAAVLVSTHGAASRALLANITKCPLGQFWGSGVPKNCSVSAIDLTDGEWVITARDIIYY